MVKVVREADEGGFNFGGAWHSDWSFQPAPPAFTLLWSVDVPPHGGDTMWSNQELAFETLSDGLRTTLDGARRRALARAGRTRADGVLARSAQGRSMQINTTDDALAEHVHPCVPTHPDSGGEALFVNPTYSVRFDGWSAADSAPLLQHLYEHSTRDAFTCRFRWTPNTLAIWDNRSTQHNALERLPRHTAASCTAPLSPALARRYAADQASFSTSSSPASSLAGARGPSCRTCRRWSWAPR